MKRTLSIFSFIFCISVTAHAVSLRFLDKHQRNVSELLKGELAVIVIDGLKPDSYVTLRCGNGNLVSRATFRVPATGIVDLSRVAPLGGTYQGVDVDGMWWSRSVGVSDPIVTEDQPFTCVAEQNGVELARASLARHAAAPGVSSKMITFAEHGIAGRLSLPAGPGPFPTILFLGGSEGGIPKPAIAEYLASKGYAVLGLAYFRVEGLPPLLNKIPVEYFGKAIEWMRKQPQMDPNNMGIFGVSRGGEAALLISSTYPNIFKSVISHVGSGVAWSGEYETDSSWTLGGKDVPFLRTPDNFPHPQVVLPDGRVILDVSYQNVLALEDKEAVQAAMIRAEKIRAPILFTGGMQDMLWPSCTMGKILFDYMKTFIRPYEDHLLCFENAGHKMGIPGDPTTNLVVPVGGVQMFYGGTAAGSAHAQRQAWALIGAFLHKYHGGDE